MNCFQDFDLRSIKSSITCNYGPSFLKATHMRSFPLWLSVRSQRHIFLTQTCPAQWEDHSKFMNDTFTFLWLVSNKGKSCLCLGFYSWRIGTLKCDLQQKFKGIFLTNHALRQQWLAAFHSLSTFVYSIKYFFKHSWRIVLYRGHCTNAHSLVLLFH